MADIFKIEHFQLTIGGNVHFKLLKKLNEKKRKVRANKLRI